MRHQIQDGKSDQAAIESVAMMKGAQSRRVRIIIEGMLSHAGTQEALESGPGDLGRGLLVHGSLVMRKELISTAR